MRAPPQLRDRVLLTLVIFGAAAVAFGGFVCHAPNRVADGLAFALRGAPAPLQAIVVAPLALLGALAFVARESLRRLLTLAAASGLMFACLFVGGDLARRLAEGAAPAARTALGPAFWSLFVIAGLAALDAAQRGHLGFAPKAGVIVALIAGFVVMAQAGLLAHLSLAREFAANRDRFFEELVRHIGLVCASVAIAIALSGPLAALALARERSRGLIFATLGVVQTIPSIALFGALIAPLAAISARFPWLEAAGVGGVGAAPAIIALTLYSLGPLARSFVAGFSETAHDVKDAARAMGFERRRLFLQIELPLALPALIAGLRVVSIQAIGLAAVAALIGAGGLGVFVFQGIGQYALDLVLLGAIPIILLALAADALFAGALAMLGRRA